jgi:transcription initiation factor IIE alpha subunit
MVYHVNCDYCDWDKDVDFVCPKCDKPTCSEDHEQATKAGILGYLHNGEKIEKLKAKITDMKKEIKDMNDRIVILENIVLNCKRCNP